MLMLWATLEQSIGHLSQFKPKKFHVLGFTTKGLLFHVCLSNNSAALRRTCAPQNKHHKSGFCLHQNNNNCSRKIQLELYNFGLNISASCPCLSPHEPRSQTKLFVIGRNDSWSHRYKLLSHADLAACVQRNHMFLCEGHQVLQTDLEGSCLGAIYLQSERKRIVK